MKTILFFSSVLFSTLLSAQSELVINYEEYIKTVLTHHPLARVADIKIESGIATLQKARGAFDPKIDAGFQQKDLDGKRYYDIIQAGVKIPTWLGVTVEGGYNENDGLFLNPERFTTDQGLIHAGLSLSLGKGLFIDARRAGLRQAHLAQDLAIAERELMLNDLVLSAGMAYWNWYNSYHATVIYSEAADLAQVRFNAVKQSALLGDRPYIDTLEASIQFQARTFQLQEAVLNQKNAVAKMSIYLWLEGQLPMDINPDSTPIPLDFKSSIPADPSLTIELEKQIDDHPMMTAQTIEINRALVELDWKREQLKPKVDLKYNALNEPIDGDEITGFNTQDYTLGIGFSMPILMRKERGSLNLSRLKIEAQKMKQMSKRQEIWLKARMALNDWDVSYRQIELLEGTARDYGLLLDGERELFNQGESSLFLVNSRESKFVNARLKLIELNTKNKMAELKTLYAMANLNIEL